MTAKEVANLSGVSVRTLHHYDKLGLLVPQRSPENDYREYSENDINKLQEIIFFKECGFSLTQIKGLQDSQEYSREEAFAVQKKHLLNQRRRLDNMLDVIEKSIKEIKGEISMSNSEKFRAFKEGLISENERAFGNEVRGRYGEEQLEKSNQRMREMTEEDYELGRKLEQEILELMKAQKMEDKKRLAEAHKQWLTLMWGGATKYSKQAHLNMVEMYLADPRFLKYYNNDSAAVEFLREGVKQYL